MNPKSSIYAFRATPQGPPEPFTHETIKRLEKQIDYFKSFLKDSNTSYTDTKKIYYLLSTKFIRQWRKYSGYDAREAGKPYPATGIRPHPFNQDLIQTSNDIVVDQEPNSVYNNILRSDIIQKNHFIIVTQELMSVFQNSYNGIRLPRRLTYYNPSKRLQMQVHMPRVKFVVLSQELIPHFKAKFQKFPIMNANISRTANLIQWKKQIARFWIKGYLKNIKYNEKAQSLPPFNPKKIRIWQIQSLEKMNQYFIKIKKQLISNNKGYYQIQVQKGKEIIQEEIPFHNLYITLQQIIVIEYIDQKNQQYVFNVKNQSCNFCGQQKSLTEICKCNTASYCSLECKNNDYQHLQKCPKNNMDQQLIKYEMTNSSRKGKVGLRNLGNTCYMNSAIQCLSHSKHLTDYFTTYKYEKQINYKNPIGTNGKLVKKYAETLKNLWCDSKNVYTPSGLKSVIGDVQSMFAGYNQHDSQQFLMFMLDALHEDLNRIMNKPYIEKKDIQYNTEQQAAKDSWDFYSKRNKSTIVDLFSGQYRSELLCPRCKNKSTTYDTFLNLTLPIPTKETVLFYFMPYGKQAIFNKVELIIQQPTIQKMRKMFAKQLGIQYDSNRLKFMFLNDIIMDASEMNFFEVQQKMISEQLYCIQLTPEEVKYCHTNFNRIVIKFTKPQSNNKKQVLPISRPFWFIMSNFTIRDLQKRIWGWLFKSCVQKNINMDNVDQAFNMKFAKMDMLPFRFYLKLVEKEIKTYYYKQKAQLLSKDKISNILSNLADDTYVEYIDCNLDYFTYCDYSKFGTYCQFQPVKSAFQQQKNTTSLIDCFQKFQKPEILSSDNKWCCPKCKQLICATKTMNLYKTSKYLIIHLKRFKQKSATTKIKIVKLIDFPFKLDLEKYLINKQAPNPEFDVNLFNKKQANYQLYAVINHSGNLGGGHYISFAKNNGDWYKFDDENIKKIETDDIITEDAYVLFYQRK